jgi:hypothetical protein
MVNKISGYKVILVFKLTSKVIPATCHLGIHGSFSSQKVILLYEGVIRSSRSSKYTCVCEFILEFLS